VKEKHYLDDYLKSKLIVPAPTSYQVRKDLTITQNKWHSKSPRITFPEEVMKIEKKKNVPDPTAYKP
jgi:hypothetical protein